MPRNDTFKKKDLNKKDYEGKENAAKAVKGAAAVAALGFAVAVRKFAGRAIKAILRV